MHFDFSTGLITFYFIHININTLLAYIGLILGFIKHVYQTNKLIEQNAKNLELHGKDREAYIKKAKLDFIHKNASVFYNKIEKRAKETETPIDDKLIEYLNAFVQSFKDYSGDEPTEAEKEQMKELASKHAFEDKKGK